MSVNLKIFLIILLIFQVVLIINRLKRKKMTNASFWILLIIIMGVIVVFPTIVFKLSKLAGFEEPSNMIFLLGFFYLFYVSFIITTSISVQNEKIKTLVQEISILKERVEKNGKNGKKD